VGEPEIGGEPGVVATSTVVPVRLPLVVLCAVSALLT
jgi:hypothetical protein